MPSPGVSTLFFCVLGLYTLFVSWSLLQERINTKPYGYSDNTPIFFKSPLVINSVQALFASLIGLVYCWISHRENPFLVLWTEKGGVCWFYVKSFFIIAVASSVSSPLGYESLKHVDYIAFLLAKSCKLLPVMLIHFVLYRTRFPLYKYVVAGLVTTGVVVFTLGKKAGEGNGGKFTSSSNDGNTVLGMAQLLGSMLLDGFTNSTQDQMLLSQNNRKRLLGAALMCILNALICLLTLVYLVLFKYSLDVAYSLEFIRAYPRVLIDLFSFAMLGALGQVFVFLLLEKFGSLILVTATVTRKMISMILSVVLFGHLLTSAQWIGVLLVFGGIAYEAYTKMASSRKSKGKED